uniref:Uncharacterized protein n=1 Tax=Nothoprocta perdicaria TaxID=30464 RepID=A0A8C6YWP6_NOTPE
TLALRRWLAFYRSNYVPVGKLVGRYYDENGAPTEALRQAEAAIEEGLRLKAESDQRKQQFPPCNSEWSSAVGSRFWAWWPLGVNSFSVCSGFLRLPCNYLSLYSLQGFSHFGNCHLN